MRLLSSWLVVLSLLGAMLPQAVAAIPIPAPIQQSLLAPTEWTGFQPQGWITGVPFTASVTVTDPAGLDTSSARYRTSIDGGVTWSSWITDDLQIGGALTTTQSITVTGLALPDASNNKMKLRIRDVDGNLLYSPTYPLTVDTTLPLNPGTFASSSHVPNVWSNDPTVDLDWTAAEDSTSGVDGYTVVWDQAPLTVPVAPTTTTSLAATSPPLTDGSDHYAHLRAADRAGLLADGALHLGPFLIDTLPPTSVIASPAAGVTYADVATISGTAADAGSAGVEQVSVNVIHVATGASWDGAGWTTAESWLVAAGSATWELSTGLPPWADGQTYTVRSRASDSAGNVEGAGPSVTFDIDNAGPGAPLNLEATPAGWTNVDSFDITWANPPDPAGIAGAWYKLETPPTHAADGTFVSGAGLEAINDLSVGSDGAHDLYVWLEDGVGNADHAQAERVTLHLDTSPPGVPLDLSADPIGWASEDGFEVTWINPTELSGVAGAWYKLDSAPTNSADGTLVSGVGLTQITDLAVGSEGEHDLYVWLEDALGHRDHAMAGLVTLRLDTTAPGAPTNLDADPDGWQTVNRFSISWRNPADRSGIAGAYWKLNGEPVAANDGTLVIGDGLERIDDLTVPAEGQHDVYLWLQDVAGNADHRSRNVLIHAFSYDGTPPSTDLEITGPAGRNDWYTGSVVGTLVAEDDVSGVIGSSYRLDAGDWISDTLFTLDTEGIHQVEYHSWDAAGNLEPVQQSTVSIDSVPPSTQYTLSATPGPGGWYSNTVSVTVAIADLTSGPEAIHYRVDGGGWFSDTGEVNIVFANDGQHRLEYYGQDMAGNEELQHELAVPIDMQPPSTAYQLAGDEGLQGWFTSPVTVSLLPEDTVSGITATYYRLDGGAWQEGTSFTVEDQGIHVLAFYSVDGLGNQEQWYPVTLKIDTRPPGAPTRPSAIPSVWTNRNDFELVWANPQDLSGIGGACYKLNDGPSAPDDGICRPVTANTLPGVQVPVEGAYDVFLWLRDGAGNVDHNNRNVALDALRYDATPPATSLVISGSIGWNGWYTSPLTVRFDVEDELSGPADAHFRVDAGPWQTGLETTIAGEDKHVLTYYGLDLAGNEEISQTATVRVDLQPPGPPSALVIEPQGWSRVNRFRAHWSNPLDLSGIGGALYRFDTAPAAAHDGTLIRSTTTITDMAAPSEGRHDLYLWLADGAGNAEPAQGVVVPDAVWYDGTPPTTTLVVSGTPGGGGWYTSDLDVTIASEEDASGVSGTWYRVDDSVWISGTAFAVTSQGQHRVDHYATDVAGNVEVTRTRWLNIDREPPQSDIVGLATYQSNSIFTVHWQGDDGPLGSGVSGYDLQVRQGRSGPWLTWMVDTSLTSALFAGQPGSTYYFRVRGRDVAGHTEEYTGEDDGNAHTSVQVVLNPGFESQSFDPWTLYGALSGKSAVATVNGPQGQPTWAARLGSPGYGASTDLGEVGTVPTGAAAISQTITVPGPDDMVSPALTLWYRIFTYDVLWSQWNQRHYDTFEVTIRSSEGISLALALRDGNDAGPDPKLGVDYGVLKNLGWRYATIDLTPYAGQTIQVVLANHNRWDHHFNTWTLVDDVQLVDRHGHMRRYMPLVLSEVGAEAVAATAPPQQRTWAGPRPR